MLQRPLERDEDDREARAPSENLEARQQITIVRHLLGQPPQERKREHAIQQRRNAALFAAVLTNPASPSLVAEKVVEMATSASWQLRHPVGPDASPFLGWRAAMSDEAWIDFGALDDDAWYDRVKADFGVDARPRA